MSAQILLLECLSMYYEIRVQGQLDSTWSDWFDGLEVTPQESGETLIAGPIPDQAVLSGILTKVFYLRLPHKRI